MKNTLKELVELIGNRRSAFIEIDCGCRTTEVLNYLTSSIIEAYEAGNATLPPTEPPLLTITTNMNTTKEDVPKMALCLDCDKKYEDFGIDITLPTAQWNSICPEDGLLCGGCIVNRCASLKGAIAIRAVVEVKHILV